MCIYFINSIDFHFVSLQVFGNSAYKQIKFKETSRKTGERYIVDIYAIYCIGRHQNEKKPQVEI